jgi:hypothetical protein
MKYGCICVVYVDCTIFAGPDADKLSDEIKSLGVSSDETQHSFQLWDEGEVGDFLTIWIAKQGDGSFLLIQTVLIDKTLKAAGMENAHKACTIASTTPVGADRDGDPFHELWEYATVVGMIMYLASNTRPDIAYAVHQAARYTHAPKASRAVAVKQILRYLRGTQDKGIIFKTNRSNKIDCHVDADFSGLFGVEDGQDPFRSSLELDMSSSSPEFRCCGYQSYKRLLIYRQWRLSLWPSRNRCEILFPSRKHLRRSCALCLTRNTTRSVPHTPRHSRRWNLTRSLPTPSMKTMSHA